MLVKGEPGYSKEITGDEKVYKINITISRNFIEKEKRQIRQQVEQAVSLNPGDNRNNLKSF